MRVWFATDAEGRVNSSTTVEEYTDDSFTEVEVDDGFDFLHQGDYRLVDGELVYDGAQTAAEEAARREAEAEAERRAIIDAGAAEYFADGGKEAMERAIEEAAASGGADPQLQAIARMQVMTMDLTSVTSTECVAYRDYWPEWRPDTEYAYQQPLRWKGLYYRASKALTSSATYPPDTAGESEYYPVEVAPDGVIVYRECHGQYDMVRAGETRHYPDAEGPVYRARMDTAYDPDTVPDNWELA